MTLRPPVLAALALSLTPGVGPRTYWQLVRTLGSAEQVLAAQRNELLEVEGVGPKIATAVRQAADRTVAEQEWKKCEELGVRVICPGEPAYSPLLEKIPDPPAVLYVRGELLERDQLALAIVGSRQSTMYGRQQAERLAGALARAGLTIVSGLARGIDSAAHRGALAAGGRTIAVLGTGVANIYPPEHKSLAEEILQQGALLSEMPLDQTALPGLFPQRNRIISGLSLGVLVVEATRNSGALHTIRHATEQGREVLAVPGRVDSLSSEGCHDLLRDGATLVRHADDVLEVLGPLMQPVQIPNRSQGRAASAATSTSEQGAADKSTTVHSPRELTLNPLERELLGLVTTDPIPIDQVLAATQIEASRVLATLTILEMKRFVKRLPGGQVHRVT